MPRNLYSYSCKRCKRSYSSSESNKIYCSTACESKDKYDERYPSQKKEQFIPDLTFPSIYDDHLKKSKPDEMKQAIIKSNEKWLNRKPLSPAEMKKRRRRNTAYRDTFKLFIPKFLKVMRG